MNKNLKTQGNRKIIPRKSLNSIIGLLITIVIIFGMTGNACAGWNTQQVDGSEDMVGEYTSIALDSDGYAHISYYDQENGELKHAKWTGSSWSIFVVDDGGVSNDVVGLYTSIALDDNDNPHISYYDATNQDLKYAYFNPTALPAWNSAAVDQNGNVGEYTSIAMNSSDAPHISYYDTSNGNLKYATLWSGTWTILTVDSTNNVGMYTSITTEVITQSAYWGWVNISYHDQTNGNLRIAYVRDVKGAGYSIGNSLVDNGGNNDVGEYTSIAANSIDYPCISYYDNTNKELEYAQYTGGGWQKTTVDTVRNCGMFTSIAIDSNNEPHISYYDEGNKDLRYAFRSLGWWFYANVDGTNDVGPFTSIALDSSDTPQISYFDDTNDDLRHAYYT